MLEPYYISTSTWIIDYVQPDIQFCLWYGQWMKWWPL